MDPYVIYKTALTWFDNDGPIASDGKNLQEFFEYLSKRDKVRMNLFIIFFSPSSSLFVLHNYSLRFFIFGVLMICSILLHPNRL